MKVFIQHPDHTPYIRRLVEEMSHIVEIKEREIDNECTHFLSLQMGGESQVIGIRDQIPEAKIITYCWDCYEWIFKHPRGMGYNWGLYGEQCKISDIVMVPSYGQVLRLGQHWDIIPEKTLVIPAYAQLFDYNNNVRALSECCHHNGSVVQ